MTGTTTRLLATAVTATATTAYYATPDLIESRRARAWTKAALLAAMAASAVPEIREARAAEPPADPEADLPRPVVVAAGAGAVAAGVAATVAAERWIFRRGERRSAAGVRWAHTRTGVVMGLVAGAAAALGSRGAPHAAG